MGALFIMDIESPLHNVTFDLLMKFLSPISPFIDTQHRVFSETDDQVAGFFVFHEQKLVVPANAPDTLDPQHLSAGLRKRTPIFVGTRDARPYYAISISDFCIDDFQIEVEVLSLRSLFDQPESFFQLAGRALQLVQWDRTHLFCGRCGSATKSGFGELVRVCSSCDLRVYPRLSPCVIMLVHRGDQIVLAQRPGIKNAPYTVQAGFIEPGESAEQAVAREVMEETGLRLNKLTYFGSQPWPFPGQLMLGYFAESLDGELTPDPEELSNAGWFDYRELPRYPGEHTIAGKLIRHFVKERSGTE